ncbi:hypothetical protein N0V94_006062 [Neodidymelliopsis sp. IMI 364377]|nr:hypothetical protein N0V94_006062 [Neodidymelliopsis sp. IMI 364377]
MTHLYFEKTDQPTLTDIKEQSRGPNVPTMQNISKLQSALSASTKERSTSISTEDTLITTLRAQGQAWVNITAKLNSRCNSMNEVPLWTEAAVYSRFLLVATVTATPAREVGFEPLDYAHLRNAGSGKEGTSKAGKKRVKDFQNATELSANIRKPVQLADAESAGSNAQTDAQGEGRNKVKAKDKGKGKGKDEKRRKGGEGETIALDGNLAEILVRAVARVEENFWVYVADEMERESGVLIEAEELNKFYNKI